MTGNMKRLLKFYILCGLLVFVLPDAYSQTFKGFSDLSTVGVGQAFNVTFEFSGGQATRFSRPDFSGFDIIGHQSYSGGGGMQIIINGKVVNNGDNNSQKWIYTLVATNTGDFTIGSAKVVSGGKTYSSPVIKIKVVPGNGNSRPRNQAPQYRSGSQDNQPTSQQGSKGNIFVKAIVDKTNVFEGEPVIVTYRIYTDVDVQQYSVNKIPSFDGFWNEDIIGLQSKISPSSEIVNGKRYMVADFRKVALYPQRSGKLTIEPIEVEAVIAYTIQASNSFFDDFFKDPFNSNPFQNFSNPFEVRTEKRKIKSNPVTINVKPLPENGKPEVFSNAVGNFNVKIETDHQEAASGDALLLTITVSGKGNLPLLEAPNIKFPDGFQVFDPEVSDKFTKTASGIEGSRTFQYTFIPQNAGDFSIENLSFAWFNPVSGQYQSTEFPPVKLKIKQGKNRPLTGKEQTINEDIRHIHSIDRIHSSILTTYPLSSIAILLLLPFGIFALLLYFLRKKIRLMADIERYRAAKAIRIAKRRLKNARLAMQSGNQVEFVQEISKALWLFVADKFNVSLAELNLEKSIKELTENGVSEEYCQEFSRLIKECEFALFAPGAKTIDMHQILQKSGSLIINIQTAVK